MLDNLYAARLKQTMQMFMPYMYKYAPEDIGDAIVRYEMDNGASASQIYSVSTKMMDPACKYGINNNNRINVTELMMLQEIQKSAKAYSIYKRTSKLRKW